MREEPDWRRSPAALEVPVEQSCVCAGMESSRRRIGRKRWGE